MKKLLAVSTIMVPLILTALDISAQTKQEKYDLENMTRMEKIELLQEVLGKLPEEDARVASILISDLVKCVTFNGGDEYDVICRTSELIDDILNQHQTTGRFVTREIDCDLCDPEKKKEVEKEFSEQGEDPST